jgi:hypothetical protein
MVIPDVREVDLVREHRSDFVFDLVEVKYAHDR